MPGLLQHSGQTQRNTNKTTKKNIKTGSSGAVFIELPSLRLLAAVHLLQQTLCTRPMYVEVDDDIVRAAVLQLISQTAHSDTPSETDDAQINFNFKRARGRTESICSYHIPAR